MLHGQTCRSPHKVSNFACKLIKRVMIHVNARLGVFCAVTGGVDLVETRWCDFDNSAERFIQSATLSKDG